MRDSKSIRFSTGSKGTFVSVRRELLVLSLVAATEALYPSGRAAPGADELFALACMTRQRLFLTRGGAA